MEVTLYRIPNAPTFFFLKVTAAVGPAWSECSQQFKWMKVLSEHASCLFNQRLRCHSRL